MHFLFQPLNHLRPIRAWAASRGAKLALDAETFALQVSLGDRTCHFVPRFSIRTPNGFAYTNVLGDQGSFVGWLPYEVRRWPAAVDKLNFKQWCVDQGLRTPQWGVEPLGPTLDFLIKGRRGSFGQGITGPYPAAHGASMAELPVDCFYEAFKFGQAAKAWYWRDRPVAVEVVAPPHVVGDGRRSIEALLGEVRGSFDKAYSPANAGQILAWQGMAASDVPAAGRKVWIGYKYVSDYDAPVFSDRDKWDKLDPAVRQQLLDAGPAFHRAIPAQIAHSVYTIDAVLDPHGLVWFLEMNCHPMVHPKVYAVMLEDLLHSPA